MEQAIALQGGRITSRQKRWMKLCDEAEVSKLLASPAAKPRELANNTLTGCEDPALPLTHGSIVNEQSIFPRHAIRMFSAFDYDPFPKLF